MLNVDVPNNSNHFFKQFLRSFSQQRFLSFWPRHMPMLSIRSPKTMHNKGCDTPLPMAPIKPISSTTASKVSIMENNLQNEAMVLDFSNNQPWNWKKTQILSLNLFWLIKIEPSVKLGKCSIFLGEHKNIWIDKWLSSQILCLPGITVYQKMPAPSPLPSWLCCPFFFDHGQVVIHLGIFHHLAGGHLAGDHGKPISAKRLARSHQSLQPANGKLAAATGHITVFHGYCWAVMIDIIRSSFDFEISCCKSASMTEPRSTIFLLKKNSQQIRASRTINKKIRTWKKNTCSSQNYQIN